jgi:hypothetical protein
MTEKRPVPRLRIGPLRDPPRREHRTGAEARNFADMLKDALDG